jgi:L-seryl-tRNA(Ser) seleniumtransferase
MMKVSKEDMIALLAAVERYVLLDHKAEWREWDRRLSVIENALKDILTLHTERVVPPLAHHVPHLLLTWNESRLKVTREGLTQALARGEPPIQLGGVHGTGEHGVLVSVFMLGEGEDEVVAKRLHAILKHACQSDHSER